MALRSFFDPFSAQVWLAILIAYILVSLLMFVIARVTPYERHASREGEGQDSKLTLSNAFWYTLTGFVFKSSNINPRVSLIISLKRVQKLVPTSAIFACKMICANFCKLK